MNTSSNKKVARVVGVIYLAGFVVGIGGNVLIQSVLGAPDHLATISANSILVAFGAILWLLAVIGDALHGVLMFPILKQYSERSATGYLVARIVDATFIAIMILFILIQIPLGIEFIKDPSNSYFQVLSTLFTQAQMYSYQIGMSALGVSGLILCYALLKAKLVPRWLALWGLFGYAILLLGMLSAIMGSGLGDISSIPGGLWEVFVGVWLIVKGFTITADSTFNKIN